MLRTRALTLSQIRILLLQRLQTPLGIIGIANAALRSTQLTSKLGNLLCHEMNSTVQSSQAAYL
jgi:hypothetical protein